MAARTRATDVLARLGGDEFAILMTEATEEAAAVLAAEMVDLAAACSDGDRRLTASIGFAMFDGADASELLVRADSAMYAAKAAGGHRFEMSRSLDRRKARFRRRAAGAPLSGPDARSDP